MTENLKTEMVQALRSMLEHADSMTTKDLVEAVESIYEKALIADYMNTRDQHRQELQQRVLNALNQVDGHQPPVQEPPAPIKTTGVSEESINLTPEIKVVPAPDGPPPMPRELEEEPPVSEEKPDTSPQAPEPPEEPVEEPVAQETVPEPEMEEVKTEEAPKPKVAPVKIEKPKVKVATSIAEKAQQQNKKKSLHTQLAAKALKFGLNDRLAYVKHLFEGNADDFNRVVSQINTLETWDEANEFIEHMIKPDYNWQNKLEFEERFVAQIKTKFE